MKRLPELTPEQVELATRRIFAKLFRREEREDGSFVLVNRRTGEVLGGWTGKRDGRELPL